MAHMAETPNWLVVSTPLKKISQWKRLSHILWKIKNVPNHQPDDLLIVKVHGNPSVFTGWILPGTPVPMELHFSQSLVDLRAR